MIKKTPKILYEDDDMLVINKPEGLMVHPDGRTKEPALTDWILKTYPDTAYVGEPIILASGEEILRPGIVHRLDKETTGVMVIAKTPYAYDALKSQFEEHKIKKTYVAFVEGNIKEERGMIDKPIGRSGTDFRKRSTKRDMKGIEREAKTSFKVIGRIKDVTLLMLWPLTGRTHQIRVHMKSIHHPVLADNLYGKRANALGFKRTALHALKISFKNLGEKEKEVIAPLPRDFKKGLDVFGLKESDLLRN